MYCSTAADYNPSAVIVEDSILKISMSLDHSPNEYGRPQGLGSAVSSTRFMLYGKVTARIKTGSSSPGVVSAFIVRNEDPGDEIDFEIVGRDPTEAETNFYYRTPPTISTDLVDYDNIAKVPLGMNTATDFHNYEIEWMPEYIIWRVDGVVIRSLFKNETKDVDFDDIGEGEIYGSDLSDIVVDPGMNRKRKKFPSTPARIQLGIWDGGQGVNGTAEWAGYPTDWSTPDKRYDLEIDFVDIQCCNGVVPMMLVWIS
ncbi:hypothetical protein BGW38_008432 [Lunasporangiospora selenospora]|uniref:GH16 domain-containing protein n=1 Tax=Lunasporangiospora selenospora TaxID=979761 RepID=A0A9P6G2D0_9FUNG|nr:hypothetical protein BGW38_008432 [Lunasporangiospora selenospora]